MNNRGTQFRGRNQARNTQGANRRNVQNSRNQGFRQGARSDRRTNRRNTNRRASRNGYYNNGRFFRAGRDYRRWNSSWRNNRRFAWRSYRNFNRSIFRLGRYYSPYRNYRYSRLRIGFFLDSLFYQSRYYINDPYSYRLPAVYGPYRWVRYYDDVVLVNIYTGEVVDVVHDFFW